MVNDDRPRARGRFVAVPRSGFLLDFSTFWKEGEAPQPGTTTIEGVTVPDPDPAFDAMEALEAGAIANPDENRRVGHYWLRAPDLAPEPAISRAIEETRDRVIEFASRVREGTLGPAPGARFEQVLHVGIGGSALGPQLAADALPAREGLSIEFLDNTDPEGFERVLGRIGDRLERTLVLVVSKSGGTPETRNGMEAARAALLARGLDPARHLAAITGEGSALDARAREEGWVATFPMWDWVGGRTSITSAVGLLPMALLGHDVPAFLEGARLMDEATRLRDPAANPAAQLALAWYAATGGRARRAMVVLPYLDRLVLFSRYLQQLVMESLGKERDLEGRVVHQGLTVYGNKGSTDQHAYVQQLREGPDDFFCVFVAAREEMTETPPLEVEPAVTPGDYLLGFLLGTRRALAEAGRRSLLLSLPRLDEAALGALVALFERAVGLYASLVGINAYHQPGVEAGKKAARAVLDLQRELLATMERTPGRFATAAEWTREIGREDRADEAFWVLARLAANPARGVRREGEATDPATRFGIPG